MKNLSGYWTGEAEGTNKAGFALTLKQEESLITGTAKFFEPTIGVCECLISGEVKDQVTLTLSPKKEGLDIGAIVIAGKIEGESFVSGKWQSDFGAEGIFTMNRVDLKEIESELPKSNSVFLVHGHDEGTKHAVARFLEKLGLQPVILQEQINRGMTVIEKFEDFAARAGFAVVLITPDDYGYPKEREAEKKYRARQNVILELGYFAAKLGRHRTVVLTKEDIELPSDVLGLVYETMDGSEGWKMRLARELKAAGFEIDLNKAIA
jgi:hypothetical protein